MKRSNFEVCSKYSERAIRFLSELALDYYNESAKVERHETDIDRIQDSNPCLTREMMVDPLEVESGDDVTRGTVLIESVDVALSRSKKERTSVEAFLTEVWQETEAEALVFLVQYSLMQGVSMHGDEAIKAVKDELVAIIDKAVGEPTRWKDVPAEVTRKITY